VLTLEYLCELRGSWAGLAQPLVHARDVPLLLDDQGPYILGLVRLVSCSSLEVASSLTLRLPPGRRVQAPRQTRT
jgi:hypothetical protein